MSQRTWVSSILAAGYLGFLSSWDGDVSVPLDLQQRCRASSVVEKGKLGCLSNCSREVGPPLELQQVTRFASRVAVGNSGFISSCNGDHGIPIKIQEKVGPPLELQGGELGNPLKNLQLSLASFQVAAGNLGFLLRYGRKLRVSLKFKQGSQASSRIASRTRVSSQEATGISGFLSSCKRVVRPPF